LRAPELGTLRKRRHTLARAVAMQLKVAPDRCKVQIISRRGHMAESSHATTAAHQSVLPRKEERL